MATHEQIVAAETAERTAFGDALVAGGEIDMSGQLDHYRKYALYYASIKDFASAVDRARSALSVLTMIPDSDLASTSSLTWDRTSIETSIRQWQNAIDEAAAADGCSLDLCPVEYTGVRGAT